MIKHEKKEIIHQKLPVYFLRIIFVDDDGHGNNTV
jgi:hypothetical protein